MNIHGSYFSISNPLQMLDRWLHPVRHTKRVSLRDREMEVEWTSRAQHELEKRDTPLVVEMQLMFSCVVKKRTIFHDSCDLDTVAVSDKLKVAFRPVEPTSCDPVEFATKYPVKREFDSAASLKIRPKHLLVDYVNGEWAGEFGI
ncbi:MAG: hypothetical protein AMJ68_03660 [Acidithiobacillales bacterium SG8_45]|nr:MAG: hypothetical protein AMJ68_03660 [Acidithiobacillales bacterium SG8_45]